MQFNSRVQYEIDLSDINLDNLIEFVHRQVSGPDDVFGVTELEAWAKKHGWVEDVDEE